MLALPGISAFFATAKVIRGKLTASLLSDISVDVVLLTLPDVSSSVLTPYMATLFDSASFATAWRVLRILAILFLRTSNTVMKN